MIDNKRVAVVIVAAGKGLRMGTEVPKQYLKVNGKPVLWHTVRAFSRSCCDDIIVVCPKGDEEYVGSDILQGVTDKLRTVIPGGSERFDSCGLGVEAVAGLAHRPDYVLVHDGVRALISDDVINSVLEALKTHEICCPGVAPKDTIRLMGEDGYAAKTIDRSSLRIIQTPQGFRTDDILRAYQKFASDRTAGIDSVGDITDDAMLVAHYENKKIYLTEGSYENIKITTPEDILLSEQILRNRQED